MNSTATEQAIKLTIREIYEDWYEPEKAARRRANTMQGYRSGFECHVLPMWGDMTISEITHDAVQSWADTYANNPGGGEKGYKCLRQIIRWAIRKWGLYVADPTQGIELPRKPLYKPDTLTQRRLKRLIRGFVGAPDEPTVILEAALGLRPGENYYISWQSINWRTGLVPIKGTLQQVGSELYEFAPKTPKSERELYLPTWALDRLHDIWIERGRPKGRIIGDLKPSQIAYRIQRWIKTHKLPRIAMQNLRHTWGSIAAIAGNSIEIVAAMMGHSDIQTCYRFYYQPTTAAKKRAQRKVARSVLGKTCDNMYAGLFMLKVQKDQEAQSSIAA